MANRFIKSSIWTSPNLNELDDMAELFFYRLMPLPDDHGCFDADPRVLKGILFPLKPHWTPELIGNQLISLVENGIISLWSDKKRLYGLVINWDQHQQCRTKFKRKTPEPPTDDKMLSVDNARKLLKDIVISCYQMISSAIPLPSSLPSSPPHSSKRLAAPPQSDKIDKKIRDLKLDAIIDKVDKSLHLECTYPQAGQILKEAGGDDYHAYGDAIVAIEKCAGHLKPNKGFIGLVCYQLESRRLWSDTEHDDSKAYSNQMDLKIKQEFGDKIGNVLSRLVGNLKGE